MNIHHPKLAAIILIVAVLFISCHFGKVTKITDLKIVGNTVCFLNEKVVGTKKPHKTYTLYVVNTENGELLKKEKIGFDAKLKVANNHKVLIEVEKDYIIYNCEKLEIEQKINAEFLSNKYEEFNNGVSEITFLYDFLYVTNKTGLVYKYEPFTETITKKSEVIPLDIKHYYSYYNKINYFNNGFESNIYELKSKNSGDLRLFATNVSKANNQNPTISDDYFINGIFEEIFYDDNKILVTGYSSTDKENQTLTCLDLNLKTIWKKSISDLAISNKAATFGYFGKINNKLIFNVSTSLLCVNINTGDLIWSKTF